MPTVVSAYRPPDNLVASSIASLGDSIWGKEALQAEYVRQHARQLRGENDSQDTVQKSVRDRGSLVLSDPNTAAALFGLKNPRQALQAQLGVMANTKGQMAPETSNAATGAGEAYGSTPAGAVAMNDMTTARILQAEKYKFDNTYEDMIGPDNKLYPIQRSMVPQAIQNGMRRPMSTDQVKSVFFSQNIPGMGGAPTAAAPGVVSTDVAPQPNSAQATAGMNFPGQPPAVAAAPQSAPAPQQQAAAPAGGPMQPGAIPPGGVSTDAMYNLPPSTQKFLGVDRQPMPMVDPHGNRYGISYDGGRTVVDQTSGQAETAVGKGWQIADPTTAVGESRTGIVKNEASKPLDVMPWQQGKYAQSAAAAAGVIPGLTEHANALYGALGMNKLGGPAEINASAERARQNLQVFNQTVLAAFMNSPTSPIKEQKRIIAMLPTDAFIANPVTEANKVGPIVRYLQDDNSRLRSLIHNPAVTGDTMMQATRALIENEKALSAFVRPKTGRANPIGLAAPQAQGGAPAPAATSAPVRIDINGNVLQ